MMLRGLFALLLFTGSALAAQFQTEYFEVSYLPMQEAAELARSQVSGGVSVLASRRMLIVQGTDAEIALLRSMLADLDRPLPQLMLRMEVFELEGSSMYEAGVQSFALPGGWVRLRLQAGSLHRQNRQQMQLRLTSGQPGHMETGEVHAITTATRQWLENYGLIETSGVQLYPVTSGFNVQVDALKNEARLSIRPWLMRKDRRDTASGETGVVNVSSAATELTVPFGESIDILANDAEGGQFGRAILGVSGSRATKRLGIRLTVTKTN